MHPTLEKKHDILTCVHCNQELARNTKLNIVYCPNCGLTRFPIEIPQHLIISTTKNSSHED